MKEIFSMLIFIFVCVSESFGQLYLLDDFKLEDCNDKLGVYSDIDVSVYPYQIYFDMETYDPNEKVLMELCVSNRECKTFIKAIIKAKSVFQEWDKIAKSNAVKNLVKDVDIGFPNEEVVYFTDNKWYSNWSTDFYVKFYVDEYGKSCLIIFSEPFWQVQATDISISRTSNYYYGTNFSPIMYSSGSMTTTAYEKVGESKGGYLVFSSLEEFDLLIDKIIKAISWKKNSVKQGSLFH